MISIRTALILAAIAFATPVAANDICVTCTGPDTTYLCSVKKAEQIKDFAGAKTLSKICTNVLKRRASHASCTVSEASPCPGKPKLIGWKEVKEAIASGLDETGIGSSPGKAKDEKPAGAANTTAEPTQSRAKATADETQGPGKRSPPPAAQALPGENPAKDGSPIAKDAPPSNVATGSVASDRDPPAIKNPARNDAASVADKDRPSAADGLQGAGNNIKDAAKKTWDCVASMFGDC